MTSAANGIGESATFGGGSVSVRQLLATATARLVKVTADASLREAARLLCAGNDLVVVCGIGGAVVGVITKTDLVAQMGQCQGAACTIAAGSVMSTNLLLCASNDFVQEVWSKMQARKLKNVPITDADGRPLGVLNARNALGALLQGAKNEESLLRDYVMGVGYR